MMTTKTLAFLTVLTLGLAILTTSSFADKNSSSPEEGALVLFLTNTDSDVAGHALHISRRMLAEGRGVTLVLIGDAGRIALQGAETTASVVNDASLQKELAAVIDAGGSVFITPPTLRKLSALPKDLIAGVAPPTDPLAVHNHMFDEQTKLMVF